MGKISTQSELCEDMSPAKVPNEYLSPHPIYQSKGIALLPPEHVAEPKRILKKKIDKEKGKGKEMTTSWNALQEIGQRRRQSIITKRALGAAGAKETCVPREPELTSLS